MKMTVNSKILSIPLLLILLLNAFIDVFLGSIALANHNFMIVGILAIAFAIQGLFMTSVAKSKFC